MERFVQTGWLLDFYGACLTPRQLTIMQMHYNQDLSLGEIAQLLQISRQAVADILRRAGNQLLALEQQTGLAARAQQARTLAAQAAQLLQRPESSDLPADRADQAAALLSQLQQLWDSPTPEES